MSFDSESLIVAVDGGGSTCRVSVFDRSGSTLGYATGGSANITTNFNEARDNIVLTIAAAYANAGLQPERAGSDAGYLGLAGANIGDRAEILKQSLGFARACVSSDREIAVQGALGDGDGTVAQAGTGSFFSARRKGNLRHIGGWGFQLSDDCGGAILGRKLLRATIAAYDGLGPTSPLTDRILKRFGGTPHGLVEFAQTASPSGYGAFAKDISAAYATGDKVAADILQAATRRLVEVLDHLDAQSSGPVCLLGGLGPTYRSTLPDNYRKLCMDPLGTPLDGAFQLAKKELLEAGQ